MRKVIQALAIFKKYSKVVVTNFNPKRLVVAWKLTARKKKKKFFENFCTTRIVLPKWLAIPKTHVECVLSLCVIPYESAWSDDLWQSGMDCHLLGIGGRVCFLYFPWYGRLFLNDAASMEILKLWVVRLSFHPWCVRWESFQVAACVYGILSNGSWVLVYGWAICINKELLSFPWALTCISMLLNDCVNWRKVASCFGSMVVRIPCSKFICLLLLLSCCCCYWPSDPHIWT